MNKPLLRSLAFLYLSLLPLTLDAQQATLNHNSILRSGPSTSGKRIATLPAGTAVTIVSRYPRENYVRIQTVSNQTTGWVLERNVTQAAAPETTPSNPQPATSPAPHAGALVGAEEIYPNASLTPGKPDPTVLQSNIAQNICNKSWTTESVRPSTSVTNKIKTQTMAAYGFTDPKTDYELDHLISLQNGGCPDCVENLWPEAYGDRAHPMTQNKRAAWNKANPGSAEIQPGSLEKDLVENHVHDEICYGIPDAKLSSYAKKYPATVRVTLERGQQILAADWYACYVDIMNGNKPCE